MWMKNVKKLLKIFSSGKCFILIFQTQAVKSNENTTESQQPTQKINQEMANLLISDLSTTKKPTTTQSTPKKLDLVSGTTTTTTATTEPPKGDSTSKTANESTTQSPPVIVNSKIEQ